MANTARIAMAWKGLPAYGARLIRSALEAAGEPVVVIGTRAQVPVEGVEQILGAPVVWVEDDQPVNWAQLELTPPQLFFQTSWATPAFNSLTSEVKRTGGKVVCLHDNRYKGNLRQLVGSVYYRLFMHRRYDAAWAPGSAGRRFCRFLGIPDSDIYEGLYSGWTEVFHPGPPLDERPPRILFIGQYIERKGLKHLVDAWLHFSPRHPEWQLRTYGQGPLEGLMRSTPGIEVNPFKQSQEIAEAMRGARFVIMPSINDNWPLTIHEAASAGCGLLLSENIGNRFDLATDSNSVIFPAGDANALERALEAAATKDDAWLRGAGPVSVEKASAYGPHRFARVFVEIRDRFLSTPA
jgi:glycosyltransferase involved in cell wall biosynthesis